MAVALSLIGWFLYLDKNYTPVAVVVSVVVFNAAFGFRLVLRFFFVSFFPFL